MLLVVQTIAMHLLEIEKDCYYVYGYVCVQVYRSMQLSTNVTYDSFLCVCFNGQKDFSLKMRGLWFYFNDFLLLSMYKVEVFT